MNSVAVVENVSFEQRGATSAITNDVLQTVSNSLSHDQVIVSRAITLLELTFRNARSARSAKPMLFWKRMQILAAVLEKLYERVSKGSTAPCGALTRLALRFAEATDLTSLQILTLYCSRTTPTECSRLLERVLLKTNAEITRLHPKSKAHLLH